MGLVDVLLIRASRMTLLHQPFQHPESTVLPCLINCYSNSQSTEIPITKGQDGRLSIAIINYKK